MKKSDLFFNVLRLPVDFLMLLSAGLIAYLLRTEILSAFRPVLFEFNLPLIKYLYLVVFVATLFMGAFAVSGLYSMRSRLSIGEEFFKILVASSAGIMIVIIYIFLRQELFNSRFLILGSWFFAILLVFIGRLIMRWVQSVLVSKYNFGIHRLLIIGEGQISSKLISEINSDPGSGYRIIKHVPGIDLKDLGDSINKMGIDEIILSDSDLPSKRIEELIDLCHERHVVFKFIPAILNIFSSNFETEIFKGFSLVELKRTKLDGWGRVMKRSLDFISALIGLLVLSPIFGIVAFAIKWETEGPVFVKLKRVSGNKEFELYKFRSMIDNAHELNLYLRSLGNDRPDAGPLWKMKNDPRITKTGRFIRKTRIDELPQLLNVLRGEMSIVGPRPHQSDEIEKYERHHKKVLAIKSGATGLAQVSGSSDLGFEEEVSLDAFYIDNWSFWLDIKIILRTIIKMLSDKSAV